MEKFFELVSQNVSYIKETPMRYIAIFACAILFFIGFTILIFKVTRNKYARNFLMALNLIMWCIIPNFLLYATKLTPLTFTDSMLLAGVFAIFAAIIYLIGYCILFSICKLTIKKRPKKFKKHKIVKRKVKPVSVEDTTNEIAAQFTRDWISANKTELDRINYIISTKDKYIKKLSEILEGNCKDAERLATKYYNYYLNKWKS